MAPRRRHVAALATTARPLSSRSTTIDVINYRAPFEAMARAHERRERDKIDAMRPRDELWFVADPFERGSAGGATISGRDRLRRLDEAFAAFDRHLIETERTSGRSPDQRWFHREMKKAIMAKLFRDDLDANLDSLLREFATKEFRREVMAITPRRYGKTWAVAMFAAAALYALEASEQAIFSTGRRASRRLLDIVSRFIHVLPGFQNSWIDRNNEETLWVKLGDGTTRKIYSYPSKVEISFLYLFVICLLSFVPCLRFRLHALTGDHFGILPTES